MTEVRIEGSVREAMIQDIVERHVREHTAKAVRDAVDEMVSEALEKEIRSYTAEVVRPIIDGVMDEGWRLTNRYGEPTGQLQKPETLVRDLLVSKKDSYARTTWLQDEVAEALRSKFKEEIANAQKQFRAELKKELGGRMAKVLADAVGLRVER